MVEGASRLTTRLAALIAGGAAAGLAASLWAPWYGADLDALKNQPLFHALAEEMVRRGTSTTVDAWRSFGYLDWVLAAAAAAGIAFLLVALVAPASRLARGLAAFVSVASVAGAAMCLVRIIDPPGTGAVIKAGAALGLACAILLAVAGTIAAGRLVAPEREPKAAPEG